MFVVNTYVYTHENHSRTCHDACVFRHVSTRCTCVSVHTCILSVQTDRQNIPYCSAYINTYMNTYIHSSPKTSSRENTNVSLPYAMTHMHTILHQIRLESPTCCTSHGAFLTSPTAWRAFTLHSHSASPSLRYSWAGACDAAVHHTVRTRAVMCAAQCTRCAQVPQRLHRCVMYNRHASTWPTCRSANSDWNSLGAARGTKKLVARLRLIRTVNQGLLVPHDRHSDMSAITSSYVMTSLGHAVTVS
jgi:hypothetical protein